MEGNLHLYRAFLGARLGARAAGAPQAAGGQSWWPGARGRDPTQAPGSLHPDLSALPPALRLLPGSLAPAQTSLPPQGHQPLAPGHPPTPTPCLKLQAWPAGHRSVDMRGHVRTRRRCHPHTPERSLRRHGPTGTLISDFQPPGPSLVSSRVPGQGSRVEKRVE